MVGHSPGDATLAWVRYGVEFPPAFVRFLALFPFLPFSAMALSLYLEFRVYPSNLHKCPLIRVKLRHGLICITMPLSLRESTHDLVCITMPFSLRESTSRLGLHNNALGLREAPSRLGLHKCPLLGVHRCFQFACVFVARP